MTCPQCRADWCWLCGERITINGPYPHHFDRRNALSRCAGQQFTNDQDDEEPRVPGRCHRCVAVERGATWSPGQGGPSGPGFWWFYQCLLHW